MFWVVAILALALLIIVHEGGHYLVAKWCKMRVERFSLGFGPALISWRHKGTQFQLAPIPMGGFVQITGMNPHEEYDPNDPNVYPNRPAILRFLTIFAGPATNILFSTVFVFFVFALAGSPVEKPLIGGFTPDSPAAGKLIIGDRPIAVNGRPIVTVEDFQRAVKETNGQPATITVMRAGYKWEETIQSRRDGNTYRIGVKLSVLRDRSPPLGIGEAIYVSLRYPIEKSGLILGGLWEIVTGRQPAEVIGPVGMVAIITDTVRAGWVNAFELLAILSVYLGLFNLLPLPALDGGRLVFLAYELVTRRRPNPRVEATVHTFGFLVLFAVMILVVFKDIMRLVK